jgi:glycoprotein-N-acetylgalactosamine 3-beta-galactosyltransferase
LRKNAESAELHARRLADEVRVLCWVMTNPENHKSKAFHVKATWGRHCNKLIFISDQEGTKIHTEN